MRLGIRWISLKERNSLEDRSFGRRIIVKCINNVWDRVDYNHMAQDREYKNKLLVQYNSGKPIPVAARSKAWVYGRSFTGIVGSNAA